MATPLAERDGGEHSDPPSRPTRRSPGPASRRRCGRRSPSRSPPQPDTRREPPRLRRTGVAAAGKPEHDGSTRTWTPAACAFTPANARTPANCSAASATPASRARRTCTFTSATGRRRWPPTASRSSSPALAGAAPSPTSTTSSPARLPPSSAHGPPLHGRDAGRCPYRRPSWTSRVHRPGAEIALDTSGRRSRAREGAAVNPGG